jgi:hypothetical protein
MNLHHKHYSLTDFKKTVNTEDRLNDGLEMSRLRMMIGEGDM